MASITETGHAKIVANFEEFISAVITFRSAYNPSKTDLKLEALQSKAKDSRAAMADVNKALSTYKTAVAARRTAFASLSRYVTRILNALKASESTIAIDKSALSLVRKIQGNRISAKLTEELKRAMVAEGKEVTEISSSQMSIDSRLDNFDKLIRLLNAIPEYKPNEDDLKVSGIMGVYNDLRTKNTAVITAEARLKSARIYRDNMLYKPFTGIVDTVADAKAYIKSVFGTSSPQFKQVSRLRFISRITL